MDRARLEAGRQFGVFGIKQLEVPVAEPGLLLKLYRFEEVMWGINEDSA